MVAQDPANLGEEAAGLIRLEKGIFYNRIFLCLLYDISVASQGCFLLFQGSSLTSLLPAPPLVHPLCHARYDWIHSGSPCVARVSSREKYFGTWHTVPFGIWTYGLPNFERSPDKPGVLFPWGHLVWRLWIEEPTRWENNQLYSLFQALGWIVMVLRTCHWTGPSLIQTQFLSTRIKG